MNASSNNNFDNLSGQLSGLLDGELSPEVAEALMEKVSSSPQLQVELEALKRTRELLGELPRKNAPKGFCDDILEQIERKRLLKLNTQPRKKKSAAWVKAAASAAILAITGGLFMYISDIFQEEDWVARQEKLDSNITVTLAENKSYDIDKTDYDTKDLKHLPARPESTAPSQYRLSFAPAKEMAKAGASRGGAVFDKQAVTKQAMERPAALVIKMPEVPKPDAIINETQQLYAAKSKTIHPAQNLSETANNFEKWLISNKYIRTCPKITGMDSKSTQSKSKP